MKGNTFCIELVTDMKYELVSCIQYIWPKHTLKERAEKSPSMILHICNRVQMKTLHLSSVENSQIKGDIS